MAARSRVLNNQYTVTGTLFYITTRTATMTSGDYKWCDDYVDNREAVNPLMIRHISRTTPVLSGVRYNSSGVIDRNFAGYPPGIWAEAIPDPQTIYPMPNTAEGQEWAWELLAKTNPSLPHVNLPAFIGEMKDIPSLVKGWGRSLLRSAAQGHISWRWAIKPMISDIRKLCKFVDVAEERFRELANLRDKRFVRKRVTLASDRSVSAPSRRLIHSEGALCYATRTYVYSRKLWGTANWKVRSDSPITHMNNRELMQFTRRTMMGLNSYGALAAAWELVPWSWFVDWFSNVGTLVQATNNSVGLSWSRLALMQTSKTEVQWEQKPGDMPSYLSLLGKFDWSYTRKGRQAVAPIIPFPLLHLPILSSGKLSILAALAVLRR